MSETECVVDGALALVLRISTCAGVAPLRVSAARAGRAWRVTVSPSLASLQRILMTILNLIALAALVLDFCEEPDRRTRLGATTVTACVWIFDLMLVMSITSLAAYCGSMRMKSIMRILKQLQQININLCNNPCIKTEKIGVLTAVCILAWAIMVQVADFYVEIQDYIDKDWSIMVMYGVFYVAKLSGVLAIMQWSFTAKSVHAAAAALNHQIRRLCHDSLFTADELRMQAMIVRLASSHMQIGEVMEQMNVSNGTFVMAVLAASFLHFVVTPYYLLVKLSSHEGLVKTALLQVCWSILHVATLLLMVEPCHWTQEQREMTKYLLSRLMVQLRPHTAMLSRELDQFAKQAVLTDVKFSPLGILTLGRPYIATMLGNVTTYLIILLQFQTRSYSH